MSVSFRSVFAFATAFVCISCTSSFNAAGARSDFASSSGSGTSPAPPPAPAPAPVSSAYYVAPDGNDNNAGTVTTPFATLTKAQTAMQVSSIKTTYIRAGKYFPSAIANCDGGGGACGLNLGSKDSGETWSYYPPDGYNTADITGGSTAAGNGLSWVIYVGDNSNVTINGLSIHNFQYAGIGSLGGVNNLLVENNVIFNGYNIGNGNPSGFACYGCGNTTISHNVVHDIAGFGISFGAANGNISNMLVTGNVLYNTCTVNTDCGALYVRDTAATATNLRFINNYVHDGSLAATLKQGGGGGSGIYADDCASNMTVSGNVLTGRNGSNTIHIHGGSNNLITGNIEDLAHYQTAAAVFQTSDGTGCNDFGPMSGNRFERNIIVSGGGGGGFWLLSGTPSKSPMIQNNAYYNYAGSAVSSTGDYSDSNPIFENPQISAWEYNIASSSPVFNAPVNFTPLVQQWGPPGYVTPHMGTLPSAP